MKTKNYLLILATAVLVLNSCGGRMSQTAYNEEIVRMHTQSSDYLNLITEEIFDDENMSNEDAKLRIDSLNRQYDRCIKRLNEMKYPDIAADWHKVTTQLFVYIKDSIIPLYSETLNYEPESKEWYRVWNKIDSLQKGRASDIEDQMIKKQEEFAATVGAKLK
jgi:hypothetical protein